MGFLSSGFKGGVSGMGLLIFGLTHGASKGSLEREPLDWWLYRIFITIEVSKNFRAIEAPLAWQAVMLAIALTVSI